jgi:lysophospholipase L1-like esterase
VREPLRIVYFGDSITSGQRVDPRFRWTTVLDGYLRAAFGDHATASENAGVPGETTRIGLERFPEEVQDRAPDVMTLQYGMNDCNCWWTDRGLARVSAPAFRANLIEMIDRARHFGVRHLILATNPRSLRVDTILPSGEVYEEANTRYSEIVREVAAETGVELCDVRRGFEAFDEAELRRLLLDPPDLLHLSVAGHARYAELIWPQVERAIAAIAGTAEPGALPATPAQALRRR